jgi:plasmid stabilization system protein ParE
MQCLFSPLAELDFEEIGDYIAMDNPHRAVPFIQEVWGQCLKITANPEAAPSRPEPGKSTTTSGGLACLLPNLKPVSASKASISRKTPLV